MRYQKSVTCWLLFMIFYSVASEAQISHLFPFQVLHAENAFHDEFDTSIRQFSLLEANQQVYLIDGHIVFVDYYGKFYELEGSTITDLKTLSDSIEVNKVSDIQSRVDLKLLFSSINRYVEGIGNLFHCPEDMIEFDFISHTNKITVSAGTPLKLSWSVEGNVKSSGQFQISIINIFDEEIGSFEVDTSFIELDLRKIKNESSLYLLKVVDKMNSELSSIELAIEVHDESANYTNVFFEEPKNAAEALQIAFSHEKFGNIRIAREYYELSCELSDREIYKTLLEKFNNRTSK
ncbi:MAG: hypothetical protein AAFQ94_11845 [Bacteroidota bacterium]